MLRPWLYTEQKRSGNAHKLTGSQESDAQKHEGNGVVQCGRLTSASASPLKQRSLRLVGRAASSPQASKCGRERMIRRFAKKLRAGQGRLELRGAAARLDLQQRDANFVAVRIALHADDDRLCGRLPRRARPQHRRARRGRVRDDPREAQIPSLRPASASPSHWPRRTGADQPLREGASSLGRGKRTS